MLFDRYIKNKRGKAAVFGLAFILVLSLFAEFIANDKPIILKYQGEYFFPIAKVYTDARFGGDFPTEANYKDELIRRNIEAEGFMVMPPIEFSYNTVDYELNEPFRRRRRHGICSEPTKRGAILRHGCCTGFGCRLRLLFY